MTSVDLTGKTALVTGAGVRLGAAFARALAGAGADVVVHYHRSRRPAESTAAAIKETGRRAELLQADLSDLEAVQQMIGRADELLAPVDLLINSAAVFSAEPAARLTPANWQAHIDINLRAPVFLTAGLAAARDESSSSVVNILDWRALRPGVEHFAYGIAKAGLAAATASLARSFAPHMRVNGLALGAILPPADGDPAKSARIESVPLGRWGEVEEVVDAMLFLLGGPSYITGEVLHIDGGRQLL